MLGVRLSRKWEFNQQKRISPIKIGDGSEFFQAPQPQMKWSFSASMRYVFFLDTGIGTQQFWTVGPMVMIS
jgi:hypothetical protein